MNMRIVASVALVAALSGSAIAQFTRNNFSRNNGFGNNNNYGNNNSGNVSIPTDFQILLRKSIFNKDRHGLTPLPGDPGYTPPRQFGGNGRDGRGNRAPALRGILRQDDDFVALLEEPRSTPPIVVIRKGDALPNDEGVVTDITLDDMGIAATADQAARRIKIGQNLQGVEATIDAPPPPTPAATPAAGSDNSAQQNDDGSPNADASPTPTPAPAPSGPALSLDEIKARMMAKRKQQNGK